MVESIALLPTVWEVTEFNVTLASGVETQVCGSDPLRWCLLIQLVGGSSGKAFYVPNVGINRISFDLSVFVQQPIRIDQRDYGPLPTFAWYCSTTGPGNTAHVTALRWKG